jgi:hypothetical protein
MTLRKKLFNGVSTEALSKGLLTHPDNAHSIEQSNYSTLTLVENNLNSELFYNEQIAYAKQFFAKENFQVADALFDYLLALKAGKIRKNGYTPDHGHEIDQIIPIITSLEKGDLKKDRAAIEAKYGSVEKWINAIIVHDIGEDFNVLPADLQNTIREMIQEKHQSVSMENEALIQRASRSMERLTHYRKYSISAFEKVTGTKLDTLDYNEDGIAVLDHAYINLFATRMNLPPEKCKRMQVFAVRQPPKGRPESAPTTKIIVTQYGRSPTQETPSEENDFGAEWTSYVAELLMTLERGEEEDFYDFLVKMGDRVQGMGSRIAIQDFTIAGYADYLDKTNAIFFIQNMVKFAKDGLYKNSPLKNAIESINGAMNSLHSMGRLFIEYYPGAHKNGDRGFAIEPLLDLLKETGRNALHFSDKIPQTRYIYGQAPARIHPIAQFMKDYREGQNPELIAMGKLRDDPDHPVTRLARLYFLMKNAIMENGPGLDAWFERHLGSKEPIKVTGQLFGPASITDEMGSAFPHDTPSIPNS